MKKILWMLVAIIGITSCTSNPKKEIITEKIQYDVSVQSQEQDWWINNLEGSKRERFIKKLLNDALNQKVGVYDYYSHEKLTPEALENIKGSRDTLLMQSPNFPYNDTLLVMERTLDYRDITKVRFLEAWSYDGEKITTLEKQIMAIAPLLENYDEAGHFRGYQPLFWIYTTPKNELLK
ncbi:MAG: hypothetical protein PHU97_07265 [Bacteroidales bacterium]|nr:hypothetical protein [Bacteroidales bacterium]MDD2322765.1 hypothetical protein [Bacteroidales bacterium]MDD3011100.1 hypothetical protein [Bacteroidales bacterium]MDD3960260.1 hypothetical protein [Bacteroidales bacterium]MDY0284790.1 hypothetical protein [Bacteroidales bacterium]